jgi:hypothetical protein
MRFCIVGTGRSGTTLLAAMLSCHPEVHVMRESHWIPKMYEFFGTGVGNADQLTDIVLRTTFSTGALVFPEDPDTLRALYRPAEEITVTGYCDRLGRYLAERAGKTSWADKTPDYGAWMTMLQVLWPTCRFVHVIRDGMEVAQSMFRHPGYRWLASAGETWAVPASFNNYRAVAEASDRPLHEYAELWCRRLRRIQDEATRLTPGSYLEVRFEALIADPAMTTRALADFLGLDPWSGWIDEASRVVDLPRIRSRRTADSTSTVGQGPLRLMVELGYSA